MVTFPFGSEVVVIFIELKVSVLPVVCNENPRMALLVELLFSGEVAIPLDSWATVVAAETVMEELFEEVMLLAVTDMVEEPVLVKLKPEPVKSASPPVKVAGALAGPRLVGLEVFTVIA